MKKLLLVCFLIQLSSVCLLAQSDTKCPTISVTCPSGAGWIGESATFTANISGEIPLEKLEYFWTISAGRIAEEQGTPVIRVLGNGIGNTTITASVEVRGLPIGCPSNSSVAAKILTIGDPEKFDEYENLLIRKEHERLSVLVNRLNGDKDSTAVIVLYTSKNRKAKAQYFVSRLKTLKNYLLVKEKISPNRIRFVNGGDNYANITQIWFVPLDALRNWSIFAPSKPM